MLDMLYLKVVDAASLVWFQNVQSFEVFVYGFKMYSHLKFSHQKYSMNVREKMYSHLKFSHQKYSMNVREKMYSHLKFSHQK